MSWSDQVAGLNDAVMDCLGDSVTVSHEAVTVAVEGIFSRVHQEVDPDTGAPISVSQPTLGVRLSDLPFAPEADLTEVTAEGSTFLVRDIQLDGQGMAILVLHEQGPGA